MLAAAGVVVLCARTLVLAARAFVLAAALVLAAGCANVTTAAGERLSIASEEFADYVERVFRAQNRVATELAFALADIEREDSAAFRRLGAAEEALLAACAGLNELANSRRSGERLGGLEELRAARQAPECERETAAAAAEL